MKKFYKTFLLIMGLVIVTVCIPTDISADNYTKKGSGYAYVAADTKTQVIGTTIYWKYLTTTMLKGKVDNTQWAWVSGTPVGSTAIGVTYTYLEYTANTGTSSGTVNRYNQNGGFHQHRHSK